MVSVVRGCHDCHITVLSSTDGTVQCGDGQSGHLLRTCHVQGRTDGQGHIDGVSSRSRSDTCAGNAGQNLDVSNAVMQTVPDEVISVPM